MDVLDRADLPFPQSLPEFQFTCSMATTCDQRFGALMEGEPFTLDDLVQEAESAKSTEQSILGLIGDTAPSRSGRGC